jgi:hypothetical protein
MKVLADTANRDRPRRISGTHAFQTGIPAASIRKASHVGVAAPARAGLATRRADVPMGPTGHPLADKGMADLRRDRAASGPSFL